jgi:mono/diheme cytochrome c family protein
MHRKPSHRQARSLLSGAGSVWVWLALACGNARTDRALPSDAGSREALDASAARTSLVQTGSGRARPEFCARGAGDAIAKLFCGSSAPDITSLAQLRGALRLNSLVLLGHSTALGGRFVSGINPRAIAISSGSLAAAGAQFAVLAFTRGVQRVELAALDFNARRFNFYLIEFSQACNAAAEGCNPGDLYTPDVETGWLEVRIRDDEALKNAAEDCRRCHGGGPNRAGPMLLMRELLPPWTHWLHEQSVLRGDFLAAKGTLDLEAGSEPYAGTPFSRLTSADALELPIEAAERLGLQPAQPLLFPSAAIGTETGELASSDKLSPSPTWQALYDAFRAGDAPAPPYQFDRATDADKLAALAAQYQAFLSGALAKDQLSDLSDVFSDDPQRQAEIGLAVEPNATAQAVLRQVCAACHNQTLDPTVSRARFDAELSRIDSTEIATARERIELPEGDPRRMPPDGFRRLDSGARERLAAYLRSLAN